MIYAFHKLVRAQFLNADELKEYSVLGSCCSAARLNECTKRQIKMADLDMFEFQYIIVKKYWRHYDLRV